MALSAFFLMFFLLQHLTINMTSVFSAELFNQLSHFMGTNPVVQFLLQPVLMFGVVFHFVMGFILELKNNKARVVKYAKNNSAANSSWFSRNMIWSGLFILFFMVFHFKDFWVPEMIYKYVEFKPEDPNRYYEEVVHMFESPLRVGVYVLAFVFLTLHLLHGFSSAFQSVGANNKYTVDMTGLYMEAAIWFIYSLNTTEIVFYAFYFSKFIDAGRLHNMYPLLSNSSNKQTNTCRSNTLTNTVHKVIPCVSNKTCDTIPSIAEPTKKCHHINNEGHRELNGRQVNCFTTWLNFQEFPLTHQFKLPHLLVIVYTPTCRIFWH